MNAEDRKNIILDVAEKLFYEKGYDNSSTAEIIKKSNIARGTLYYYFAKKEDLLDAVIERKGEKLFAKAKEIAINKNLSAKERFIKTLIVMSNNGTLEEHELDQIHSSKNALMHQKINHYIVKNATPFLTEIINDGINDGIFNTKFPKESIEMILIYINEAFDHTSENLSEKEMMIKIKAFFYNIHKLLGAKEGSLNLEKILE